MEPFAKPRRTCARGGANCGLGDSPVLRKRPVFRIAALPVTCRAPWRDSSRPRARSAIALTHRTSCRAKSASRGRCGRDGPGTCSRSSAAREPSRHASTGTIASTATTAATRAREHRDAREPRSLLSRVDGDAGSADGRAHGRRNRRSEGIVEISGKGLGVSATPNAASRRRRRISSSRRKRCACSTCARPVAKGQTRRGARGSQLHKLLEIRRRPGNAEKPARLDE